MIYHLIPMNLLDKLKIFIIFIKQVPSQKNFRKPIFYGALPHAKLTKRLSTVYMLYKI